MKSFTEFINESREELAEFRYLVEIGLIPREEVVAQALKLFPGEVGLAKATLLIDYDFAAQHDSYEVQQLLLQWFDELNEEEVAAFHIDRDSLEVSDWEVEDYWEWDPDSYEEWPSEELYASFNIAWLEGTSLGEVRAWVDGLTGLAFSDFKVELTQQPKIGI